MHRGARDVLGPQRPEHSVVVVVVQQMLVSVEILDKLTSVFAFLPFSFAFCFCSCLDDVRWRTHAL
jgi:hypothetical protein